MATREKKLFNLVVLVPYPKAIISDIITGWFVLSSLSCCFVPLQNWRLYWAICPRDKPLSKSEFWRSLKNFLHHCYRLIEYQINSIGKKKWCNSTIENFPYNETYKNVFSYIYIPSLIFCVFFQQFFLFCLRCHCCSFPFSYTYLFVYIMFQFLLASTD